MTDTENALAYLREQFGEGWVCVIETAARGGYVALARFRDGDVDVTGYGPDPMSAAKACVEARDAAGFALPTCYHCGERRLYRSLHTPPGSHATFGKNPSNTRCAYCDDWLGWANERDHADRLAEALREYGEHGRDCILSRWEAGRPTEGGGYEMCYAGAWYETKPVDRTPPCTCGLSALLAAHDARRGGE